jgi:predicted O-linked N-acetylglucosamine transferase (SPINDLY family)
MLRDLFRRLVRRASPDAPLDPEGGQAPTSAADMAGRWPPPEVQPVADFEAALREATRQAAAGRLEEAMSLLLRLTALQPRHAKARTFLGNVYKLKGDTPRALEHYRAAIGLQPDLLMARVNMLRPLMDVHDWSAVDSTRDWMRAGGPDSAEPLLPLIHPMDAMLMGLPADDCRRAAEAHAARTLPATAASPPRFEHPSGGRLRVAYLSRDFRDHAVGHLVRSLLCGHDRQRFEVFAYSVGRDDASRFRRELETSADHFHDMKGYPDRDIADHIRSAGIHVLVDLGGHTTDNRLGVLAARPAPIQWHYLGYPGTTGAAFVDGFVADDVVAPLGQEAHFSEPLVRLETCLMVSDPDLAQLRLPAGDRTRWDLPPDALVLCAFHQTAKIHPAVLDAWLTVLRRVPKALLWLKEPWPEARARFSDRARAHGVDPSRIRYAANLPGRDLHLQRVSCADLFLDAFGRYGGHSTALEALWLGVPVVTSLGDTFAARVPMSLLRAAQLEPLVARDPEDYAHRVTRLCLDEEERHHWREKLAEARRNRQGLFDIEAPVRALEKAMTAAWRQRLGGADQPPLAR